MALLHGASVTLIALPSRVAAQTKARSSATPTPQPQPTSTGGTAVEQAIPLPQIPIRADEVAGLLSKMAERLMPDPQLDSIDETLKSQEAPLRARQRGADDLIASNPTIDELRGMEQDWQATKEQYDAWRTTLKDRATAVEADVESLAIQQAQWETTLNQNQNANAVQAVVERIRNTLSEIKSTRSTANGLLTLLVALQNRVSKEDQVILEVLKNISQAKDRASAGLLTRDSSPLWAVSARGQSTQSYDPSIRRSFSQAITRARYFVQTTRRGLWMMFAFFLSVLALFFAVRGRILRKVQEQPSLEVSAIFFRHPVSLSLLATLIVTVPALPNLPILIKTAVVVLFTIPVLRFLPSLISPVFRALLYLLVAFGLTAGLWELVGVSQTVNRVVTAGLCVACIALGIWLIRKDRVRQGKPAGKNASWIIFAIRVALTLIFASLLANVFGYVALSRVLRVGVVQSSFFAAALYTAFITMTSLYPLSWRFDQASMLSTARASQESAAKWISRLLGLAAFVIWLYAALNLFAVRERVLGALTGALAVPIAVGAASFTLGDVLTFVLILVLGAIFAHVIRVILLADVLGRLSIKHGLPNAISTITYYMVVLAGFFLALAAAGVELSRFTLLTGAFGVGVGFGLQNVINNFVSGIILLFERPIRIGDFLEVGNTMGEVERIGMRSTTIRTPQGAYVIVPNSNLISNQVTNWTLTDRRRRSELSIEVAYGTDPERVLKLLVDVACSHPDVLAAPKPTAIFQGFGNTALGFELRFWVPLAHMHQQVKSEIGVKVAAALHEAGIEIALPRRELYVKSVDGSSNLDALSLAAPAPDGPQATSQQIQKEVGGKEK